AREDVLKRAEREAKEILDKTTRDSQQLLADIYHQRDILKKELNALRKRSLPDAEATEAAERIVKTHGKAVDHLVAQVDDLMDRSIPVNESPFDPDTLTEGDMIWVKRFRKEARFVKLDGDKYLWVDMQGKKVRVECSGVGWVRSGHSPTTGTSRPPVEISVDVSEPIMPLLRLNLVGKRVDEALDELDRYMDQVIRSGISEITIIHGFGTGKLQDAVVKYLRRTSRVLSARSGDASEGGGGVTVVRMNTGD
ncbi:Smr/MutS family protein, partial [bacterium]|nr:Smr/MutS family protein [candidate division CSSED10-310 bacterium]